MLKSIIRRAGRLAVLRRGQFRRGRWLFVAAGAVRKAKSAAKTTHHGTFCAGFAANGNTLSEKSMKFWQEKKKCRTFAADKGEKEAKALASAHKSTEDRAQNAMMRTDTAVMNEN